MENTIFYEILCASFLIILVLCIIGGTIRKDIEHVTDTLVENQQKLSRQISSIKTTKIHISDYEQILMNNIISALIRLEEEKFVSYKKEISLLNKIFYNG